MAYPFNDIERKWQKYWAENKTFRAENPSPEGKKEAPKYYALDMFPYPSGAGLHVGHPLGYIASDIVSRYKRLKGFNVLHPMGYDSFGLPAEQYAIQTGQHPEKTTKENIARYREQMDKIGFSFDWDREVRTSDPNYYKWTQWIFLKLFNSWYNPQTDKAEPIEKLIRKFQIESSMFQVENTEKKWEELNEEEKSDVLMEYRLAYLSESWVNWCPQLGTVLANEEVKDGVSERGGYPVERKLMPQWSLRITAYAERLLNDLEKIEWTESIKESQRNWIGKSEGSSLRFCLTPSPSPKERGECPGYHTAKKEIWSKLKQNARENRKDSTEAEKILWECVRDSRLGYKIRRQHAIDQFITDFVCLDKKLIIEVDGEIHLEQKDYDEGRTCLLEEIGYRLIRFTNAEVISKTDWVCQKIVESLNAPFSFGEGRGDEARIEVFTTRPDTIFGVTFLTLAPENELVQKITTPEQKQKVDEYIHYAKNRSERERQSDVKKITGEFTGAYAIHPFNGEKIPVWIGDYVLAGYGTGAVMAVPSSDERDYKFAKQFGLEIIYVIEGTESLEHPYDNLHGKMINSDFLNGMESHAAIRRCIQEIEKRGLGKGKTQFRLRDAIFGRQRYWGEPIPIYYENGIPKAMKEEHLPLVLPEIDKFLPTETGEPPLARAKNWFYHPEKGMCSPSLGERGLGGEVETTTMPGWAGSSWYYLRYMDPQNKNEFAGKEALNYWKDVDLYIGGSEHATGHLLYVRFWTKFLYDLGLISVIEPAKKLINQGMILGRSLSVFKGSFKNEFTGEEQYKICSYIENGRKKVQINSEEFTSVGGSYGTPYVPIEMADEKDRISFNQLAEFAKIFKHPDLEKINFDSDVLWESDENGNKFIVLAHLIEKMSKSKRNVVSPDDICTNFGADTLRLYEMFLGPLEQSKPWNTAGITGVSGFLNKFWRLFHSPHPQPFSKGEGKKVLSFGEDLGEVFKISDETPTKPELKILHKTIKKIQQDIENYSFNTSVSAFMICANELTELKCNKRTILEPIVILLSPFAPHIAEELWEKLGHKRSITFAEFPQYNEALMQDDSFAYPISFNGKMRFNLELPLSLTPAEIEKEVLANEQSIKFLEGKYPKKVIVVPKRIVNIVV